MRSRPVTFCLTPLCGGAYTRLRLCIYVPTPLPTWVLRRLCALLALFSGERTRFVLSVDSQAAPWSESWVASIAELPARYAETQFVTRREHRRGTEAPRPLG